MFKIGDKVKIKNYEDIDIYAINKYCNKTGFNFNMKEYCGKVFTISYKYRSREYLLCGIHYFWNEQWLKLYNEKFEQHKQRMLNV